MPIRLKVWPDGVDIANMAQLRKTDIDVAAENQANEAYIRSPPGSVNAWCNWVFELGLSRHMGYVGISGLVPAGRRRINLAETAISGQLCRQKISQLAPLGPGGESYC